MRYCICATHARIVFLLIVIFGFSPDAFTQTHASAPSPLPIEFTRAMEDAKDALPFEISKNLTPVLESNKRLMWKNGRVLVVYWATKDVYKKFYKDSEGKFINLDAYVWVTVVPELASECKKMRLSKDELTTRLEQLLGLRPKRGKSKFIEMWVDPHDLFRPCPDPEISDQECEVDFARSRFLSISLDYIFWFNDTRAKSYLPDNGLPWTRLGYTYDWGSTEPPYFGLSEFVIASGARVEVKEIINTADYCV
jgi:hypothetical protein